MLSKSLSTSVKRARLHAVLGDLAEFAQALYPLLVAHADDFGREVGDPFTVKNTVDPSSRRSLIEFADALIGLKTVGLVRLYGAESDRIVLQIVDFDDHQQGLSKRTHSRFPEPPSQEIPGISENLLSRARAELNLREENLREVQERAAALTLPPRPVEKPKVTTLAALVRKNVLSLGITDEGDLIEVAKRAAAKHGLKYDSAAIRRAIASATAQRKRARV